MACRIALRVDASEAMGTGHLRRCLSLAQILVEMGARVDLLIRHLDDVALQVLSSSAVTESICVRWLPMPAAPYILDANGPPHQVWAGVQWHQDVSDSLAVLADEAPDWLVVDHYAFDARWHAAVRQSLGCRILVIDDTCDRILDADGLLNQNWAANHREKYAAHIRRVPLWLTGPRFALLSPVYKDAPRYQFNEQVRSIGVFMGGTDLGGASAQVLKICRRSGFAGPIEIVSTSANPHLAELRAVCSTTPATSLSMDLPNLAAFFARHDLQIGAGGGSVWERCCIGAPSISLVLAANQLAAVPALEKLGALRAARLDSQSEPVDMLALSLVLETALSDSHVRRSLGERAAHLVDGCGAQRIALTLLRDTLSLRPATSEDAKLLHSWRNHPSVRAVSHSTNPIPFADHMNWMRRVLAASNRWLFFAEVGCLPVGCIRFDLLAEKRVEVSLCLAPEAQGLGLGSRLLLGGERAMHSCFGHDFTIEARVVLENIASQRLFKACEYHGGPLKYQKTIGETPITK